MVASLALAAVAALGCGKNKADRDRDLSENAAILSRLPVFPGARILKTTSAPYYREEGRVAIGHTTNLVYSVPLGTLDENVIGFYTDELRPRWTCEREELGILDLGSDSGRPSSKSGRVLVLTCSKGSALVSVNADGMQASAPTFELVVDRGAANRGRGA